MTAQQPTQFVQDVTAVNGVAFRFVAYAPGATGPYPAARDDTTALVEVYDRRFPFTENGQFTGARYSLATLIERPDSGLCLSGGIPDWSVDGETMSLIVGPWLAATARTLATYPAPVPHDRTPCGQCGTAHGDAYGCLEPGEWVCPCGDFTCTGCKAPAPVA